jgi:polyhydroxybutyrate depolymerase
VLLITAAAGCEGGAGGDAAVPSAPPGAVATVPAPGTHILTFAWGDRTREYVVDAPTGYDPARPIPLVVVLHGRPSDAFAVRAASDMDAFAEEKGVLVVYPQGVGGSFRSIPGTDRQDDVGFLRALVAHVVEVWNADPDRVYATGFSNGASMTYRLALEASDVFAAVAPVAGPYLGEREAVRPTAPVPLLAVLGLNDSAWINPMEGGLRVWREELGCQPGEPTYVDAAEKVTRTVSTCADGSRVVEYRIAEMGHQWPPGAVYGINVNDTIWDFFTAHARTDR